MLFIRFFIMYFFLKNIKMNEIELQIQQLQSKLNDLKKKDKIVNNIVLSGGSSKGFSYIGVIRAFEEFNILDNLEELAGTSIGGLFSVLIALKYNSNDLINIFMDLDLNYLHNINSDSILHLINKFGLDNGENMIRFLELIIGVRFPNKIPLDITFLDIWNYNPIKITLTGAKVYQDIIEQELYNHVLTPSMSIIKALRITMAIPPIFSPINETNYHLVDGGIVNNYPIDLFNDKMDTTLGILCTDKISNEKCKSVVDIYKSIIVYMITKETLDKKNKFIDNTIVIESTINMFHIFSFTKEEKLNIIDIGYQLTKQYLTLKGYSYDSINKNKTKDIQEKYNINSINISELLNKIKNTFDKIKKPLPK